MPPGDESHCQYRHSLPLFWQVSGSEISFLLSSAYWSWQALPCSHVEPCTLLFYCLPCLALRLISVVPLHKLYQTISQSNVPLSVTLQVVRVAWGTCIWPAVVGCCTANLENVGSVPGHGGYNSMKAKRSNMHVLSLRHTLKNISRSVLIRSPHRRLVLKSRAGFAM